MIPGFFSVAVASVAGDERPTTRATLSAVLLATVIGAAVRAVHVSLADFPLNDGALFLVMTRDLVANGFALPVATTYNAHDIPFLYPPLGFYLAGLVSLAGTDLVTIFRFLPLVVSILAIPAVYLFASTALPTRFAALVATIATALIPRSFEWTIAGGGLTRGLGVLFAVLVLWAALRLERGPTIGRCVTLGVLAGVAALSHPEAVVVAGTWLVVIVLTTKRRLRLLGWFVRSAVVAALLVLPWLAVSLSRHGLDRILDAGQTSLDIPETVNYLLGLNLTDEPSLTLIGGLALLGVSLRAVRGDWRWVLWIVPVIVLDPHGTTNYLAAILGAAAAIAIVESILPALGWTKPGPAMVWPDRTIGPAPRIALAVLLVIGIGAAIDARTAPGSPLFSLGASTRAAMAKVAETTPSDARVIVASGTWWWVDATAEWFPEIAGRESVTTVQGSEWLGFDGWQRAREIHGTLQGCVFTSVDCFDRWRATYAPSATHIFMPKGVPGLSPVDSECCPALRQPLIARGYPVVFDEPGGTLLGIP